MRVVIYARLSTKTATNELNIVDQVRRCQEYAIARDWVIVEEVTDYGESAFDRGSIEDRPGFGRVAAMVTAREVDAVLAWRPDRLWRDPIECAVFLRSCVKSGVKTVATVTEGERDPANPADEMLSSIVAVVGRYESAAKSARVKAKHRQLAELGRPKGGERAFGYEPDGMTVVPEEEEALREAIVMLLSTRSLRAAATRMDELGVPPVGGGRWSSWQLRRIMLRPRNAGLREHHGVIVGQAVWPAIIDEPTFVALRDFLEDPARRMNLTRGIYLLTGGLAVCGTCGSPLHATPKAHNERNYACRRGPGFWGCGGVQRRAGPFEREVVDRVHAAVDNEALTRAAQPIDLRPEFSTHDLAEAERALTDLARDFYVSKLIERSEYLAARGPLAERAAAIRAKVLAPAPAPVVQLKGLRDTWPSLDNRARRVVLEQLITAVIVHPAVKGRNFFDPTKIEIRWRG